MVMSQPLSLNILETRYSSSFINLSKIYSHVKVLQWKGNLCCLQRKPKISGPRNTINIFFNFLNSSVLDINLCQKQYIFQAHEQLLCISFLNQPPSHTYWIKFRYSLLQPDTEPLLISQLGILHLCSTYNFYNCNVRVVFRGWLS